MTKKYRLLKDLPFAKEGEVFQEWLGERNQKGERALFSKNHTDTNLWPNDIDNFDEWFEEVKEPEQIYYVDSLGGYVSKLEELQITSFPALIANLKSTGNYFENREEAEKYLAYLKAKTIIKQDTKGFKPDWKNKTQAKYFGCWDSLMERKRFDYECTFKNSEIYFQSEEDIKESFTEHQEEWKAYLTYDR